MGQLRLCPIISLKTLPDIKKKKNPPGLPSLSENKQMQNYSLAFLNFAQKYHSWSYSYFIGCKQVAQLCLSKSGVHSPPAATFRLQMAHQKAPTCGGKNKPTATVFEHSEYLLWSRLTLTPDLIFYTFPDCLELYSPWIFKAKSISVHSWGSASCHALPEWGWAHHSSQDWQAVIQSLPFSPRYINTVLYFKHPRFP